MMAMASGGKASGISASNARPPAAGAEATPSEPPLRDLGKAAPMPSPFWASARTHRQRESWATEGLEERGFPRASTPKFSGEQWPELQYPSSHRFVGDIQTALRKQIFDVAIAERETHIQPNGVPDDRRRELMAGKRDRHPPSYPTTGCALTFA
jgi:hypothetical protein